MSKLKKQTLEFKNMPRIIGTASVVGEMEGESPLSKWFDVILDDDKYDEDTWEKAESKMLKNAVELAIQKSNKTVNDLDVIIAGDLVNQIMSASFMARDLMAPFLGIYGACSTMSESLLLGSILIDGGYSDLVAVGASSHYSTAERQFRMPLEHANQKPPTAQWTVTGSGSAVLSSSSDKSLVAVTHGTIGKVIDAGVKDANQMGAAMAPAAVDTIYTHLTNTATAPSDYDLIVTGDLGEIGKQIFLDMMKSKGFDLSDVYDDCGAMMYNKKQDVHSGGSGCGCAASIFGGPIYKKLEAGELKKIMFVATGAMLSTISPLQGESIPSIAHAVTIQRL